MAYTIDAGYAERRNKAFAWRDPTARPHFPYGFIMETGYPEAVFTFVGMDDGTIALYFSYGGGIEDVGAQPGPARAARELARQSVRFKDMLPVVRDNALPAPGEAKLYILIDSEWRGVAAPESEFADNLHEAGHLFYAAHRVIAEVMKVGK